MAVAGAWWGGVRNRRPGQGIRCEEGGVAWCETRKALLTKRFLSLLQDVAESQDPPNAGTVVREVGLPIATSLQVVLGKEGSRGEGEGGPVISTPAPTSMSSSR